MSFEPITITRRDQEQVLIRADLADKKTAAALKTIKAAIPAPRRSAGNVFWFSPDELLLFVENAGDAVASIKPKLPDTNLIHDVTGARVVFTLKGAYLRDMLAKGAPRDLQTVEIGEVVRTRLGQIAVAFWFHSEEEAELVCFRSVADYVETWLNTAAKPDGLPVLSA